MNVPKLRFKEFTGEWKEKSFRDIVSLNLVPTEKPSSDYVRLGIRSHCKGTFHELVKIENVLEADKMFLVPKDNLILNITFAWEHAIAITDENDEGKYVSGRFPTFSFKSKELPAFYESIIRSKRMKYELGVASPGGAGRNRVLNKELFLDIPVNTTNIEEQTKISNFIRCVDDKIKNQKDIIESLEKQKKGLMQKIFSQELRFKDDDGKEFPAWEEKKLGEVAKIYDGTHQTPNYVDNGIKFVSVEDIRCLYDSNKFITVEAFNSNFKVYPQKGDILMTRIGDIGTTTLVNGDEPIAYYVSLALMKPFGILGKFLLQYIKSNDFQHELWRRTLHIAFPKKINKNEIGECLVMVPCTREQEKIAELLSNYDNKIEIEKKTLEHWQQVKKGLLQQMFV